MGYKLWSKSKAIIVNMVALLTSMVVVAGTAYAQEKDEQEEMKKLKSEVKELKKKVSDLQERKSSGLSDWLERFKISGYGRVGYYDGGKNSYYPESTYNVQDLRIFFDVFLSDEVTMWGKKLVRSTGLTLEWDIVRLGSLSSGGSATRIGEFYGEFQGVMDSDWLNLQIGRFQIPSGESYLRFSRGIRDLPFISHNLGGPWYWDEGIKFYGNSSDGMFGYVTSISNGGTQFNGDVDQDKQLTLKLFADPLPWLHLSVSGLRSGKLGEPNTAESSAIWPGETLATPFGLFTSLANFDHGISVPDDPNKELKNVTFLGADAILKHKNLARLWLAYGEYKIKTSGDSLYDRDLKYWIVELVLEGRNASEKLDPFYLGMRVNGYGTYDSDTGYMLDLRFRDRLGYNIETMTAYSTVLGFRLNKYITFRLEYTLLDVDVVSGVTPAIRNAARDTNFFGIEVGINF